PPFAFATLILFRALVADKLPDLRKIITDVVALGRGENGFEQFRKMEIDPAFATSNAAKFIIAEPLANRADTIFQSLMVSLELMLSEIHLRSSFSHLHFLYAMHTNSLLFQLTLCQVFVQPPPHVHILLHLF